MARQLKVFCTPIGFHDAYVAAPSQKAALEAWGSDANLFARGMAAVVTDPKLTKEPLDRPGEVIKRARGTAAQHLAALPKASKTGAKRDSAKPLVDDKTTKPASPTAKPSRRKLEAAQRAMERADDIYRKAGVAIRNREEALRRERHALNQQRDSDLAKLQRKLDHARNDYDRAMQAWRN